MRLSDATEYARMALDEHDLTDWSVTYDRAVRRFGQCRYNEQQISLSAPLVECNGEDAVLDVILHEVAHAIAGHEAGHGPRWKAVARRIGANPTRCYDNTTVVTVPYAWAITCNRCGKVLGLRHRRKLDISRRTHSGCGGTVEYRRNR